MPLKVRWSATVLPDTRVELTDGSVTVVLPAEAIEAANAAGAAHALDTCERTSVSAR